jgi:hypothetical protein
MEHVSVALRVQQHTNMHNHQGLTSRACHMQPTNILIYNLILQAAMPLLSSCTHLFRLYSRISNDLVPKWQGNSFEFVGTTQTY